MSTGHLMNPTVIREAGTVLALLIAGWALLALALQEQREEGATIKSRLLALAAACSAGASLLAFLRLPL